ncbi:unnamed protein product [Linum tenue]|uniref:FAD-binding PCMH-type domain-containing protein n=2 Tax=Linum tenue TaxID=586396 RepID=A0AAV0P5I8_9ROSI|nr:unnamed protein product [Linum tenue]
MKSLVIFLLTLFFIVSAASSGRVVSENLAECIANRSNTSYPRSIQTIFHPESPLFASLLDSRVQNMRYMNNATSRRPQPLLILTPSHETEIQSALLCCRDHGVELRIRSGGHDYEGLSYFSSSASYYIVVDLFNLNDVQLDLESETAWVQAGARLGELYYAIAKQSTSAPMAFPAGICPTVGLGGHIGGGGLGTLTRKHGLAADNVLDAYLMDARGRILNRKSMGEDVFWAIRGGGAASFGIVLSWKLKLVRVPPKLTFFKVSTTLEEGDRSNKLIHKWQRFAHDAPEDLFVRTVIKANNKKTIQTTFESLFLGTVEKLIPLMKQSFPELGLTAGNCTEGSWAESTLFFSGYKQGSPLEVLLDNTEIQRAKFKAKSDFVTEPIPESGFEGMWEIAMEEDKPIVILEPFGGRMSRIHESYTPFPHRKGYLYNIQYLVKWEGDGVEEEQRHLKWMNKLYNYMEPYVSKSPRAAYLNYRDLDLGTNSVDGKTSFSEASVWGAKYFKGNFKRLSETKSKFDPGNFFRYEQSIPPLFHK